MIADLLLRHVIMGDGRPFGLGLLAFGLGWRDDRGRQEGHRLVIVKSSAARTTLTCIRRSMSNSSQRISDGSISRLLRRGTVLVTVCSLKMAAVAVAVADDRISGETGMRIPRGFS